MPEEVKATWNTEPKGTDYISEHINARYTMYTGTPTPSGEVFSRWRIKHLGDIDWNYLESIAGGLRHPRSPESFKIHRSSCKIFDREEKILYSFEEVISGRYTNDIDWMYEKGYSDGESSQDTRHPLDANYMMGYKDGWEDDTVQKALGEIW